MTQKIEINEYLAATPLAVFGEKSRSPVEGEVIT
jgi:hypothetical protein